MKGDDLELRKANKLDKARVWKILQQAIQRRAKDGSTQWQDGYPNLETVKNDIQLGQNYVLTIDEKIIATAAIILNFEPTYDQIDGQWLSTGDFLVVHRVAVSDEFLGKGMATQFFRLIETFAKENKIPSIKVDTNFDNLGMLKILEKLNYAYCGEIKVRDGKRKAFEKLVF